MGKKSTAKAKKVTSSKPVTESSAVKTPRRLKVAPYQRGRFQKRIKHPGPKLSSSWQIFRRSMGVIKRNKKLFGGILLVYVVLSLLLVSGLNSTTDLNQAKQDLQSKHGSGLNVGTTLIGNLVNSSSSGNANNTYQTVLFILISLVVIWALRYVYDRPASEVIKRGATKAAFYKSMTPLIPFVLVLLVIGLQLVPLVVGSTIYALIVNGGLAVGAFEQTAWLGFLLIFAIWSLYMVSASIFGLYIVTLPDVQPMLALRSARELLRYRRWTVMRKVIALPIILTILLGIIMLPIVLWLTPIAQWVFFVLSLSFVVVAHSYFYSLYRELM